MNRQEGQHIYPPLTLGNLFTAVIFMFKSDKFSKKWKATDNFPIISETKPHKRIT